MKARRSADSMGVGILLIGIGTLFMLRDRVDFFPWVLAIIGIAGIPEALSRGRNWAAWQGVFWLIGLAVLFAADILWPGILILVGGSMLLRALTTTKRAQVREEDVAHEPVTTATLPPVLPAAAATAEPVEPFTSEHGTAPLSNNDLDTLEAELAAQVERPAVAATTVLAAPSAEEAGAAPEKAAVEEPQTVEEPEEPQEPLAPDDEASAHD